MKSVLLFAATLLVLSVTMAQAVVYQGAMDNRAGFPFVPGFTAQSRALITGDDPGGGLRLEWQAENESAPGFWTYRYRLLRNFERRKGFAFFDIETAADFLQGNLKERQVVSATDSLGAPIASGLSAVTISDPVNFNAVHDFSNPTLTETSAGTALNKSELSHYSGDPGRVPPGVPGSPASATPSVGPVPHPFYGIRVTFPGSFVNLAYEVSEFEFRLVTDRAPMWGKVFGWGDQTILSPFWYTNFYSDQIDNPARLALSASDSLSGADPYQGWVLVPGPLPAVVATHPPEGGSVPVTEPVSASFSAMMDASSLTPASFTLQSVNGPVSGTVSYDALRKSATFLPDAPLAANTSYSATIAANVRDLAGNTLGAPKSWSFSTSSPDSTPPTVSATLPGDGASYLPTDASFSASFSEAIDPASLTPESFGVAGVSGTVSYDRASRSATFTPDAPLAHNSSYTATIGTGVRDLAGNPLAAPVQWRVRTIPRETVLPFVVSTVPAARAANVVTTTTVSATFSEELDPTSITPSTFFVAGVSGTTSYDAAHRTVTFTPAAPLASNTSYRLTVTTGIRDLAGNGLGLTKEFRFTTINTLTANFSASGRVTAPGGAPLSGVALSVSPIGQSGTAPQTVVSDGTGQYRASQLLNGQYLIIPTLAGTVFAPQAISTSVTSADVSGLNFTGFPLTLTPNKASPQTAGSVITLSAAVQGSSAPYEYRFRIDSGTGFSVIQDYSSSNTLVWRPVTAGSYNLEVEVRGVGGSTPLASTSLSGYQITPAPRPFGTITINGGAPLTNSTRATLTLSAFSSAGAVTQMQFSKDGVNYFPFEPFAATRVVTLPSGDGTKTITVRFRDASGTVSDPIADSITLDRTAPAAGTLAINGGAQFTNNRRVTLELSAGPDVTQMQISKDGVTYFPWETFVTSRTVTLTQGDGVKSIFVRFRDAAGNASAAVSASIILTTALPTGTIAFTTPDPTTSRTGVLALSASALSGVTQMQFSKNGSAFFAWEPFAASRTVTLALGQNTLSVRFKDAAGNVSAPIAATITRE